jgi:DNA repair exonuclease SbcCD ATPase subunit
LDRELKHFKSISQNVELLRREKESLAYQVEELDKIRESKITLETENIKLRLERDAWACYLSNLEVNTQTPQTIISQLTRQVEEARHLQTAVAQYQQQTKDNMLVIEQLTAHIEELKDTAAKMQYEHAKDEAAKAVVMKGTEALKRHIAILESQLNMYDQEELHQGQYDELKSKRIAELEQLLKNHEEQIMTQAQQLTETSSSHVSPVQITNGPYEKLASGARLTEFLSELMNKQADYMKGNGVSKSYNDI